MTSELSRIASGNKYCEYLCKKVEDQGTPLKVLGTGDVLLATPPLVHLFTISAVIGCSNSALITTTTK